MKSLCAVFLAVALSHAGAAEAFYEYAGETASLEARGFFGISAAHAYNPSPTFLYKNGTDQNYGATARLMALGNAGEHFGFEFNGYAYTLASTAALPRTPEVERSSAMEWTVREGAQDRSRAAVDHLNLRVTAGIADLTVGRQAVNLATCFYFTPNDFFAPFSAQAFYRVFKPGVDAARLALRLGELSQLTLVGALGFHPDSAGANGYAASPGGARGSAIARAAITLANVEWAALGGQVGNTDVVGGSLQGELFKWLGLRAEGHHAETARGGYTEITAGVDHRFENSLTVRYEQFHHGSGYGSPAQYGIAAAGTPYLGMNYGALGLGYQFSPLLNGEAVLLMNYTDGSWLAALYASYSLADDAELAVGLNIPGGAKSGGPAVQSEYGLAPSSASLDLRMFF